MSKPTKPNEKAWVDLLIYLNKTSREVCEMNECTEDNHNCEGYAYIKEHADGTPFCLDVCQSDYFQGDPDPVAAIPLPFWGDWKDLREEVLEQTWEEPDTLADAIDLDWVPRSARVRFTSRAPRVAVIMLRNERDHADRSRLGGKIARMIRRQERRLLSYTCPTS